MSHRWPRLATVVILLSASALRAGDLDFSDPAKQRPAPVGAVGFPSRDQHLDVWPGFQHPPAGYGEVAFYWWVGDPLTKERILWQLDQLAGKGITALQVNYAHTDKGGPRSMLTIPSDPPLFSADWWNLFGWFLKQAKQRGMAASLSDYTLGWAGSGWYTDEILQEFPETHGAVLKHRIHDCSGPQICAFEAASTLLTAVAYKLRERNVVPGSGIDLRPYISGGQLRWQVPQGNWRVIEVLAGPEPVSLDPMHPLSGKQMIAKFFQRFEDHNPGESGRGLDFFFSDELSFGVQGWLWNRSFADEFRRRKGYDIVPELPGLFEDIGPKSPKLRLDYSDVMVSLEEENYFRPLYEWHRSRGMLYGCDHGWRGENVTEFGDYFRTQRWMTAPGNDQPGLHSNVIKNKVASSIAHLYQRQRCWLEGYYGSGWGTTSAQLVDATWRNFVQGKNLLTLHGLYYTTHGGWWEWAPPCNHFRMPYWNHLGEFLRAVERMSYVLSQGYHRADVAILYPVAAVESGLGGKESVDMAFNLARHIYGKGIDFDFMDFESLARATVDDRQLKVSGEAYRVLVLPAMRAVRYSTLEKALEFKRKGGIVIGVGALPEASDRMGGEDATLNRMVREIFGSPGSHVQTVEEVEHLINAAFPRDFICRSSNTASPNALHQKVGPRDIYMVYGAGQGSECEFRATGKVELWDPWTGAASPLPVIAQSAGITRVRMPFENTEAQLIVFSPGKVQIVQNVTVQKPVSLPVEGVWEFELKPTLDNRFGDFRLPATDPVIGAEARRFRYADETSATEDRSDPRIDDSAWAQTTYSYGPRFWKLGPLPADADPAELDARLSGLAGVDPSVPVMVGGKQYRWQPYEFSMRWGIENDPGHQGYHGLKEQVPDDLIGLGTMIPTNLTSRTISVPTATLYVPESSGTRYYLWTAVAAPHDLEARMLQGGDTPAAVWVNGVRLAPAVTSAALKSGSNPLLLRYDKPGCGYFLFADPASPPEWKQTYPLASAWYNRPGILAFDTRSQTARPAGWYRFMAPPGLRAMKIIARGQLQVWADGLAVTLAVANRLNDGTCEYRATLRRPPAAPVKVAIRIEQERGWYAGAAIAEPVFLDCGPGEMAAGDWSQIDGLSSYSGGAWYRKTIEIPASAKGKRVWLNLGTVAGSVELHINGHLAGIRLAPPWKIDMSPFVRVGANKIEALIFNTLANHYQTIPTWYRGSAVSGLIGPVEIEISPGGPRVF